MTLLRWLPAVAEDIPDIKNFRCTTPGWKEEVDGRWLLRHEKPYELLVESRLRKYRPPCQSPVFMWVGRDKAKDGLVGALLVLEQQDGPAQVEIKFAAIARHHRGQKNGVADEMMKHAFDEITRMGLDSGVDVSVVTALIHEDNARSQDMCRRKRMAHTANLDEEPELQQWSVELLIGGAEVAG